MFVAEHRVPRFSSAALTNSPGSQAPSLDSRFHRDSGDSRDQNPRHCTRFLLRDDHRGTCLQRASPRGSPPEYRGTRNGRQHADTGVTGRRGCRSRGTEQRISVRAAHGRVYLGRESPRGGPRDITILADDGGRGGATSSTGYPWSLPALLTLTARVKDQRQMDSDGGAERRRERERERE